MAELQEALLQETLDRGTNLAFALYKAREFERAKLICLQGVKTFPHEDNLVGLLGMVRSEQGDHEEALANFSKALLLRPDCPEHLNNIGLAYSAMGNEKLAIEFFNRSIEVGPAFVPAYSNLATEYHKQGKTDEALLLLNKAIEIDKGAAYAWFNMGNTFGDRLEIEAAVDAHGKAVELEPTNPQYQFNYANGLLLLGRWQEGWEHYSKRDGLFPQFKYKRQALIEHCPEWNGEDLEGQRIYLYCVQGDGDKLQFIRFAKALQDMGATTIVETPESLQELFAKVEGIDEIAPPQNKYTVKTDAPQTPIAFVLDRETLPGFDFHCELMELPRLLGIDTENIPSEPYIINHSPAKPLAKKSLLQVGLCWGGNPIHRNDHNRSCPLKYFEQLAMPGVSLFCLQKDKRVRHWPEQGKIDLMEGANVPFADPTETFNDYEDTAYWINQLDLVVTVDTSLAHLAGAMGKPVFLLLPYAPDWRWMLETDRTPWYSSMRLFRQPIKGDWQSVLKNVATAIDTFTQPILQKR